MAVLLAVPAVIARWVRTDIVSASGFADNAVAVLDVPAVRDEVVDLISDSVMDSLDVRRPRRVRPLVVAAVDDMVADEGFEDVWREAVTVTHDAVMASLLGRERGEARIAGGKAVVELDAPFDELRRLLRENGLQLDLRDLPDTLEIELAELPNDDGAADDVLAPVDAAGFWLPLTVVVLLAAGLAVAVNRWRAALITGIGLVITGCLFAIGLSEVRSPFVDEMASGDETMTENGISAIVDEFTGSLVTSTWLVIVAGVVGVVAGIVGLVLRSRRPAQVG